MSIQDDFPTHDEALRAALDAAFGRLKDAAAEVLAIKAAIETSAAARQAQLDRITPVVPSLQSLPLP